MFKKVLGLLVVLSVVIGGGTVLQAIGGTPVEGKSQKMLSEAKRTIDQHHLKLEKWLREEYAKKGLSSKEIEEKVKAEMTLLEKKESELKEKLRKYYTRKGVFQNMSPKEIEEKLEFDISLTVDQINLLAIDEEIEELEKMRENETLFSPLSEKQSDYISLLLFDIAGAMDSRAIPILVEMSKKCKNAYLRSCAIETLDAMDDKSLIPIFINALNDEDKGVTIHAAHGLVDLDVKSHPLLLSVLIDTVKGKDRDKWVIDGWGANGSSMRGDESARNSERTVCQEEAVDLLAEIGNDEAKKVIKTALKDNNPYVRTRAAMALIKLGENVSIVLPVLIDGLKYKDDRPGVYALSSLKELVKKDNKQAISALKEALKNENKDISERAKKILEKVEKKQK